MEELRIKESISGNKVSWYLGPVSYNLSFKFDHVYMIGGVPRHMLPHLSGVPHLHVNRPLKIK